MLLNQSTGYRYLKTFFRSTFCHLNVATTDDNFSSLGNIILLLGSKCGNQDAIKEVYNNFLKAQHSKQLMLAAHMASP